MTTETFQNPCFRTSGPWADEIAALDDFDTRVMQSDLFNVYKEVDGHLQQPRVGVKQEGVRVDRILSPKPALIKLGWCYGAIAIEGKAPGKKLGPVVCQCLDYSRTVWEISEAKFWVMCPWTFIWHVQDFAGDLASVMSQHRIGGVFHTNHELLVFKHAGGSLLRIDNTGTPQIGHARCGMKAGSR